MELKPLQLNPPLSVTRVHDEESLTRLVDFLERQSQKPDTATGFDIETNLVRDFFWRRTRTIQFGSQTEQYVIDLLAFCKDADELFKAQGYYGLNLTPGVKRVIDAIRPFLCDKRLLLVGVNLSFEYQNFYWQFGIRSWNFYDCAMAERCIWAGALGSMKQYAWFSMESMMARYFHVQIDKTAQTSFTLDGELTPNQVDYAGLDTRTPLAIRAVQGIILQGHTPASLKKRGQLSAAKHLEHLNPIILGDDLREIVQIENNAIGAFEDMYVHGERLDTERWLKRIARKKLERKQIIEEQLDTVFLPICGNKNEIISDEEIAAMETRWKAENVVTAAELEFKQRTRATKDVFEKQKLEEQRQLLETERKERKEKLKAECSEAKKKRTKVKNLAAKCEGAALINYSSKAQVLAVLNGMKGLKSLKDMEDESLEKFEKIPVISALRKYNKLAKEIGTYGDSWATQWTTKPCKDEGWLHPGDGRLHCVFNQYDAETGRSTSEKPNGQNLPQDKEVRECFIADPPDESIRVSNCCDGDAYQLHGADVYYCATCQKACDTHAEEYVIVTADMSGAELRIIAELADDPIWIGAFARGEDVHSVGTEILYPEEWPRLQLENCAYFKKNDEAAVAANSLRTLGEPQRLKCKCPEHNELRNDNKSTNFLLAYGGGPSTLAARIKKKLEQAAEIMSRHAAKFPKIWSYLAESGKRAKIEKKSFDMFGRRRLFPEPTWERATEKAKEDREEKLRLPEEEQERNIATFIALHKEKPKGKIDEIDSEMYNLTHRPPSSKEIGNAFQAMHGVIERAGKNHRIQGTNATIIKLALGCGFDKEGKPYLWHTLPQYKAKLIKMVHDEVVIQCPKRYANKVAELIGDAFKRAAAEKMTKVVMEFEFSIASHWKK